MTRRPKLFTDTRGIDLHFDDVEPLIPERDPPVRNGWNDFPPIEYLLQKTTRAVYCLARGVGERLTASSAEGVSRWLVASKTLEVDRNGPARFPGPDGGEYEWFFRLGGVQGQRTPDVDSLFAAASERLLPKPRPKLPEVPGSSGGPMEEGELGVVEIGAFERIRADSFLVAQLSRLQKRMASLARRELSARAFARRGQGGSTARRDRETVAVWMQELESRQMEVQERENAALAREQQLASKSTWLQAQEAAVKHARAQQSEARSLRSKLEVLLPRLVMDGDTQAVLQIELSDNPAYLRFLCALQDGVAIDSHSLCLKHVKLTATSGKAKSWWEIRLKNNIAEDYRIYYRHLENERLEVRVLHKKEQERFISSH